MNKEQIEQAEKYAKEHGEDVIEDDKLEDAFLAGAESRQAEIDELKADLERYKQDVAVGLKREGVARKVIEDKRAAAADLVNALNSALYAAIDSKYISREDYFELDRILKKHSK